MNNRWFCKRQPHGRQNRLFRTLPILAVWLLLPASGLAGDAPGWLHALASTPLPKYADDTKVVRLLDEKIVTVKDNGEVKTLHRRAYRILRPQGRDYGLVPIPFDSETRISNLKAWCIPAQGKDYEVKEKDAVESSAFDGELYSDDRVKILRIPAADPGNVIGYEYEQKERPYILQNTWWFQEDHPVRQARLILQLPAGWEYKAYWLNYAEQKPATGASNEWRWELTDIPALKQEPLMPPPQAIKGRLLVVYYPSGDRQKAIASWNDLAKFYYGLTV